VTDPAPTLSSGDKLLWPDAGLTKADLWRYMEAVAERMLPQVKDRPLTLVRYNRGVNGDGFVQKNLPSSAPDWLPRHEEWSPSSNRQVSYALAAAVDDLRWMANQNALELHQMLVRADRDDRLDLMVFDLDPGEASIPVTIAAHWLRELLDELGLVSAVKTSGKRGLHLAVPIQRRYDPFWVRALGLATARACADRHPDELTVAMRKAGRGDRLLLDWSRNAPAQTMIAAWSPRATPTGTVSMPLTWDEVTEDLDPNAFTLRTAPDRADAWATMPEPQRLEKAAAALEKGGFALVDEHPRGGGPAGASHRPER
jgi:bifunctional non-homologous end joining protein LigD